MHLINTGVQHISLDRPPDVMKGDSIRLMLAVGDSSLTTGGYKRVLYSTRGDNRLVKAGKHEVVVDCPGELR